MAFREVRVFEIREVLRLWLRGEGLRSIERLGPVDRKTARRYVAAAQECGLIRDGGEGQLSDALLGAVCEQVRPHRLDGHGAAWATLVAHHDQIATWLTKDGLTVVKAGELLARRGVVVPERTLHRYALEVLGVGRSARGTTVPGRRWRAWGAVAGRLRADGLDPESRGRAVPSRASSPTTPRRAVSSRSVKPSWSVRTSTGRPCSVISANRRTRFAASPE